MQRKIIKGEVDEIILDALGDEIVVGIIANDVVLFTPLDFESTTYRAMVLSRDGIHMGNDYTADGNLSKHGLIKALIGEFYAFDNAIEALRFAARKIKKEGHSGR